MYPLFLPFFSFYSFPMEQPTILNLYAPKGEFIEPPQSSNPITASSYELRPSFIAMVREQAFLGLDYETPTITYGSLSSSMLARPFQACHQKHFGGSCFLSHLMSERNNGTPTT